jgi:hypothetical protein
MPFLHYTPQGVAQADFQNTQDWAQAQQQQAMQQRAQLQQQEIQQKLAMQQQIQNMDDETYVKAHQAFGFEPPPLPPGMEYTKDAQFNLENAQKGIQEILDDNGYSAREKRAFIDALHEKFRALPRQRAQQDEPKVKVVHGQVMVWSEEKGGWQHAGADQSEDSLAQRKINETKAATDRRLDILESGQTLKGKTAEQAHEDRKRKFELEQQGMQAKITALQGLNADREHKIDRWEKDKQKAGDKAVEAARKTWAGTIEAQRPGATFNEGTIREDAEAGFRKSWPRPPEPLDLTPHFQEQIDAISRIGQPENPQPENPVPDDENNNGPTETPGLTTAAPSAPMQSTGTPPAAAPATPPPQAAAQPEPGEDEAHPIPVASVAEAAQLPPGTWFINPKGEKRRRK